MAVIESISTGAPADFAELRTMKHRADDIWVYFDCVRASNGPTEAINGSIEYLRGTALGFRNILHYITRALLETGGFRNKICSPLR